MKAQKQDNGSGQEKLLHSAVQLFSQSGYDGTSVRDLAAHAGVSTALIRKHYGSKQGLHEAADAYVLERVRIYTDKIFARSEVPPMLGMPEQAAEFARSESDVLGYLRYALTDPAGRGEVIAEQYEAIFINQIAQLKARGLLADDIDEHWAPYILMFLQMGPLILEPYFRKRHGVSMYQTAEITSRNAAYKDLLSRTLFRA